MKEKLLDVVSKNYTGGNIWVFDGIAKDGAPHFESYTNDQIFNRFSKNEIVVKHFIDKSELCVMLKKFGEYENRNSRA